MVKNLPTLWETQVESLDWEDPLKEECMTTHSSILAWRIPWTEEPGSCKELDTTKVTEYACIHLFKIHGSFESQPLSPLTYSRPDS